MTSTRQILHKAGVETEWVHCPTQRGEEDRFPGCRRPKAASDIILHVTPRSMESSRFRTEAFGFALPAVDGQPAQHAYVFFHRVEQAAMSTQRSAQRISQSVLLAHVVAHEIGHLLLGPNKHSARGIMRAQWKAEDLREMEIGRMLFLTDQVKALQTQLSQRESRQNQ